MTTLDKLLFSSSSNRSSSRDVHVWIYMFPQVFCFFSFWSVEFPSVLWGALLALTWSPKNGEVFQIGRIITPPPPPPRCHVSYVIF